MAQMRGIVRCLLLAAPGDGTILDGACPEARGAHPWRGLRPVAGPLTQRLPSPQLLQQRVRRSTGTNRQRGTGSLADAKTECFPIER